MREIKFRAKIREGHEWKYGGGVQVTPEGSAMLSFEDGHLIVHLIQPESIGQFTGLKDKNGKEIYESDIVAQYRGSDYEAIKTVKWRSDKCGYWMYIGDNPHLDLGEHREKLEVIGNIYENPELLK